MRRKKIKIWENCAVVWVHANSPFEDKCAAELITAEPISDREKNACVFYGAVNTVWICVHIGFSLITPGHRGLVKNRPHMRSRSLHRQLPCLCPTKKKQKKTNATSFCFILFLLFSEEEDLQSSQNGDVPEEQTYFTHLQHVAFHLAAQRMQNVSWALLTSARHNH